MEWGALDIVVPVRLSSPERTLQIVRCYDDLMTRCLEANLDVRVIIVAGSFDVFVTIIGAAALNRTTFLVLRAPAPSADSPQNGKLVNVSAAIALASSDSILVCDDDARPTLRAVTAICDTLSTVDHVRLSVRYGAPSLFDLIDLSGIFVVNFCSPEKQFWGHFGFRLSALQKCGGLPLDVLFDELAVYRRLRNAGFTSVYSTNTAMDMISHRDLREFMSQRLRYAYENFAYPLRFVVTLSILPLLVGVERAFGRIEALISAVAVSGLVAALACLGQSRYDRGRHSKWAWLWAPLWFWFYPVLSWVALGMRSVGGVRFGTERLSRAI